MGNLCGCCGDSKADGYSSGGGGGGARTAKDDEARMLAAERVGSWAHGRGSECAQHASHGLTRVARVHAWCMGAQAEARQQQFENTAVGKAAYKGVKDAKKPVNASSNNDNARDWLS